MISIPLFFHTCRSPYARDERPDVSVNGTKVSGHGVHPVGLGYDLRELFEKRYPNVPAFFAEHEMSISYRVEVKWYEGENHPWEQYADAWLMTLVADFEHDREGIYFKLWATDDVWQR